MTCDLKSLATPSRIVVSTGPFMLLEVSLVTFGFYPLPAVLKNCTTLPPNNIWVGAESSGRSRHKLSRSVTRPDSVLALGCVVGSNGVGLVVG